MHKNSNNSSKSPSGSWSMSSSSRMDSNRSTIPVPDCNCGLRTTMFKANTPKNPGRPFFTCPFHKVYLNQKLTSKIVSTHYTPYIPLLFLISPFMQLQNDARNCQYFIWLDEWEEILASEAAINGEEKHLSRNDGREHVNERLLDRREVGKGNAIDAKWKTRINSKLELLAVDLRMLKYLVFASIIMQFFNMIMQKK